MAPPTSLQECSPAGDLHTSQAQQHSALRTSLTTKLNVWNLASWNVRSLLDVDGPIEVARHTNNMKEKLTKLSMNYIDTRLMLLLNRKLDGLVMVFTR